MSSVGLKIAQRGCPLVTPTLTPIVFHSLQFAELMKVAEANTRSSNREALEAAKRKETALRQAREEQERKEKAERERQKQMMLQRVEEAKRQEEQRKKKEEEAAKRRDDAKKKAQETEQAKYGVAGSSKDGSSRVKPPSQYIVVSSAALTREEKRMAKDPLMADKIKARKAGMTASRHRKDGRLPGDEMAAFTGAINATGSAGSSASPSGSRISSPSANGMTARARLTSSFAPTLTKLNTDKRDTRTIDEITRDLKRGRIGGSGEVDSVLSGEKAQTYGDWFVKKDKGKAVEVGDTKKRPETANAVPGRTNGLPATNHPMLKPNASGRAQALSANASGSTSANPQARPRPGAAQTKGASNSSSLKPQVSTTVRKRSRERSSSLDSFIEDDQDSEEERRYAKRKPGAGGRHSLDEDLNGDTRELIWQLMGRKRSEYMSRDVDSDDEMEVTGYELEREELRRCEFSASAVLVPQSLTCYDSARIAKREDAMEEAEEKRREEEKKRRKAERSTHK
ncbi:hypothetical protein FRC01_001541 [Tulasnella sp. 417]|nr:hypothetical protein FRC01_001541 [Tulasnella sp. 417]